MICRATRDSMLALTLREALPADIDRAELREVDRGRRGRRQPQSAVLAAVQLHFELIAGADDVVGGHRNIGHRRERGRRVLEQVVAEGLETLGRPFFSAAGA